MIFTLDTLKQKPYLMHPTYTFQEALYLISILDLEGLKILLTIIAEEKKRYTYIELKTLHLYWNDCYLLEQATEKQN